MIGKGTWIGEMVYIHGAGGVTIGENVGVGPGVKILSSEHLLGGKNPIIKGKILFRGVNIEDGVDLGTGAVICPGSDIDEGTMIGAGSVVHGYCKPFSVYAGNPAVFIRSREDYPGENDAIEERQIKEGSE